MKKLFIGIVIVLIVVSGLGGIKALQFRALAAAGKNFTPPPETVSSAVVREEKWQGTLAAIGSITAVQGVTITPELAGTVREIAFESGAIVAKGDLLIRPAMRVRVNVDTYPGRGFDGTLLAINPDLDPATRSVGLRASFENADQALRPGMYAKVELFLPVEHPVLVIPATSVLSAPFGDSVYVIEAKPGKDGQQGGLSVRQQFVKTGQARGDLITVESGLKPGERVASAGVFKLRNGMAVTENNELVPKSEKSPHPPDA